MTTVVGMTDEQVRETLVTREKSGRFNRIGLSNVDERIKLTFGSGYGLKVNSTIGEGTTVTLLLPYRLISEDPDV